MRVLVACEYSGIVRDAFNAKGHTAMSCDLLASDSPDGLHMQGDVKELVTALGADYWDLVIAHPPCTYLCSSGLHWNKKRPERQAQTDEALEFIRYFMDAGFKRLALENPIGCISTQIRKPNQIVQPWQFGHAESKSTCLWLQNLPLLVPTDVVEKPASGHWENQTPSGQNKLGPSADRWKLRSTTYAGIAAAMADQWGAL
jgi:hypothetical protein